MATEEKYQFLKHAKEAKLYIHATSFMQTYYRIDFRLSCRDSHCFHHIWSSVRHIVRCGTQTVWSHSSVWEAPQCAICFHNLTLTKLAKELRSYGDTIADPILEQVHKSSRECDRGTQPGEKRTHIAHTFLFLQQMSIFNKSINKCYSTCLGH